MNQRPPPPRCAPNVCKRCGPPGDGSFICQPKGAPSLPRAGTEPSLEGRGGPQEAGWQFPSATAPCSPAPIPSALQQLLRQFPVREGMHLHMRWHEGGRTYESTKSERQMLRDWIKNNNLPDMPGLATDDGPAHAHPDNGEWKWIPDKPGPRGGAACWVWVAPKAGAHHSHHPWPAHDVRSAADPRSQATTEAPTTCTTAATPGAAQTTTEWLELPAQTTHRTATSGTEVEDVPPPPGFFNKDFHAPVTPNCFSDDF